MACSCSCQNIVKLVTWCLGAFTISCRLCSYIRAANSMNFMLSALFMSRRRSPLVVVNKGPSGFLQFAWQPEPGLVCEKIVETRPSEPFSIGWRFKERVMAFQSTMDHQSCWRCTRKRQCSTWWHSGAWLRQQMSTVVRETYTRIWYQEKHIGSWGWQNRTSNLWRASLSALAEEFPDVANRELVGRGTWAMNSRGIHKGFTPMEHALGKVFERPTDLPIRPELLEDGGFAQDERMRVAAEKAFIDQQAKRRVEAAMRMGHRKDQLFLPGDLVFYWRCQLPHHERGPFQTGKFLGPARVLATETRQEEGHLRPGSIVWLHRAGRLIRAAPEQLRKATPNEAIIEELKGPVEIPWTFSGIISGDRRQHYVDITEDVPTEEQWQTGESETPTIAGLHRRDCEARCQEIYLLKIELNRLVGANQGHREDKEGTRSESSQSRRRTEEARIATKPALWAVEVELPIPESRRGWKKFCNNPEAYIATQMKKKQMEVQERRLTPDEAEAVRKAKQKEVRNFIASKCFEGASDRFPGEDRVIRMRWLLTWKPSPEEPGGKKAKARAIVLGYQDPDYSTRNFSANTFEGWTTTFSTTVQLEEFSHSKGWRVWSFLCNEMI